MYKGKFHRRLTIKEDNNRTSKERRMSHNNFEMTFNFRPEVAPRDRKKVMRRLDNLFGGQNITGSNFITYVPEEDIKVNLYRKGNLSFRLVANVLGKKICVPEEIVDYKGLVNYILTGENSK